jgi:hypothetical protein
MSEQRLRDLGREAQDLVDLPDLASLERRGRALRFRRQVGGVAAAVVLATTAVFLFQDRSLQEPQPAPSPDLPRIMQYPGPLMTDLAPGTYELTPSLDGDAPTALVTVPKGWNAWVGPNRFDGHRGDAPNGEALSSSTWSVGVLVLEVAAVATEPCQPSFADSGTVSGKQQTVSALSRLPGYRLTSVDDDRFDGFAATHLRLEPREAQQNCSQDAVLYRTDANGALGTRGALDVWVLDAQGTTLTVVEYSRGPVPERYQDELAQVTDSIRILLPD